MPQKFIVEKLAVEVHGSTQAMGEAAAEAVAEFIREAVEKSGEARLIMATGNSQFAFIDSLTRKQDLPWAKITCFHMDEYVGIAADHPASFRRWMKERVENVVHPKAFYFIEGDAPSVEDECARYADLLREKPIDITCMGIGENGHLAFNDPPVADFDDPLTVKRVELEPACKEQQVGEGHFASLAEVPTHALTVTIPALLSARHVFCIVPEGRKAEAVRKSLNEPVSTTCPSSILRQQPHARLYLDPDSARLL